MLKTKPFPLSFLQDLPGLWGSRIQTVASQQFDVHELQKRILHKTKDGTKAKPAFYIDPRTLDNRLNTMFGGAWSVGFHVEPTEHLLVVCATLNINGIVREDISSEPIIHEKDEWINGQKTDKILRIVNEMATTAASAAAYKRAAVKFGISSYMYDFKNENIWLKVDPKWKNQFEDPTIQLKDLPAFARPSSGAQIVFDELIYLIGSDDKDAAQEILKTYWGLETMSTLTRDDSFRLATCIARVSDFLEYTGKTIEQLASDRAEAAKKEGRTGFLRD